MKNVTLFLFILALFSSNALALKKILFLGDSLTEGYMLDESLSYPALIEKKLKKYKSEIKVLNGGVSGSTTASGISRLKWFLKAKPDLLVLALGANDGLRGLSLKSSYENLKNIILLAKKNNIKILLCGMKMPPNYGEKYEKGFKENYKKLQKEYDLIFYPFLLEGVAGVQKLNLDDGIHPNQKGYEVIANNLYILIRKEFL